MTNRSKAELAAHIRADRDFWRALVEEVGRDRMNESGPMGEWTFKDLAAHLAGWRNVRIAQLEAAARGEPDPGTPWPAEMGIDTGINDWIQEQSQSRTLDDVLADYDGTFERLAAALEALPQAMLEDADGFEWSGGSPLIEGDFTHHLHVEHLPGIRAWLDSRP